MLCEEKKKFSSAEEARKFMRHVTDRMTKKRMRPYLCPICKHFHLTSEKKER